MRKPKNMYNVWTAVVVVLILVCLAGAYMLVSFKTSRVGENRVIFECNPASVEGITIVKGNYRYELEKDDGIWEFDDDEVKLPVQESVKEAVNVFSSIKGTEVKLSKEPLFNIRVEIDVEYSSEYFELAKESEKYYLKDKRGKVYSVSQVIYSIADRERSYYRDKTVIPVKSFGAEGENDFVSYNYKSENSQGEQTEINVRLKRAAEIKRYDNSSQYIMDVPYLRNVSKVDFESKVLTKIPELKAESFIDDAGADLSVFGLDAKSRGVLTVRYDDKSLVMYVGKTEEASSNVYCMLQGSKEIFTVNGLSLEFLSYDASEVADKSVFQFDESYIKSVEADIDGHKISVRNDGQSFYVGNRPVSDETAKSFIAELKKLKTSGIEKSGHDGDSIMRVVLKGNDGAEIYYNIIKTEDGKVVVSEDNRIYMKVDLKDIEAFVEYLKQLEKTPI